MEFTFFSIGSNTPPIRIWIFPPLHHLFNSVLYLPLFQLQGVCQPAMGSIVSAWAPKSERARIVGLSYSGTYI